MTSEQWKFLEDVFLSNAVRDSLVIRQGRLVFKEGATTPLEDEEREDFKEALKSELRNLATSYSSAVDEGVHIENIKGLASRLSRAYANLLNGDFLFGRAQKALNVYLKYLWCADKIACPPHCPFDNDVISTLNKLLPKDCERRWTHADEDTYRLWVAAAKVAKREGQALSEWELEVWASAQAKRKAAQARKLAKLKAAQPDTPQTPEAPPLNSAG